MAIDSPIGANGGISTLKTSNGVPSVPATAKISEMIALYNPVKVRSHLMRRIVAN
jgi:hypothetical protein